MSNLENSSNLQTHYGLGSDAIMDICYDYDGPHGCQRKQVFTANLIFVYYQFGSVWVIQENRQAATTQAKD